MQPGGRALAGLVLKDLDGGEFIRREAVGGVGRFRLHHVKQVETGAEGLGQRAGGGEDSGGGIGKIDGGDDGFHG